MAKHALKKMELISFVRILNEKLTEYTGKTKSLLLKKNPAASHTDKIAKKKTSGHVS